MSDKLKWYKYTTNNSGGAWWLKDQDWLALEKAGWTVFWSKDDPYCDPYREPDGRFLGSLAVEAAKKFASEGDAIAEWSRLTIQDYYEDGCPCCGPPHSIREVNSLPEWVKENLDG